MTIYCSFAILAERGPICRHVDKLGCSSNEFWRWPHLSMPRPCTDNRSIGAFGSFETNSRSVCDCLGKLQQLNRTVGHSYDHSLLNLRSHTNLQNEHSDEIVRMKASIPLKGPKSFCGWSLETYTLREEKWRQSDTLIKSNGFETI